MLPSGIKKYDIELDPPSPLWDEFRFLGNIDLSERPLIDLRIHRTAMCYQACEEKREAC